MATMSIERTFRLLGPNRICGMYRGVLRLECFFQVSLAQWKLLLTERFRAGKPLEEHFCNEISAIMHKSVCNSKVLQCVQLCVLHIYICQGQKLPSTVGCLFSNFVWRTKSGFQFLSLIEPHHGFDGWCTKGGPMTSRPLRGNHLLLMNLQSELQTCNLTDVVTNH